MIRLVTDQALTDRWTFVIYAWSHEFYWWTEKHRLKYLHYKNGYYVKGEDRIDVV